MLYRTKLENGIETIMYHVPHMRSATIAVFIKSGAMFEDMRNNGISHFIEHMLFKGTTFRTSKQISETMDMVGGHINAYTTKEYTCIYAQALDEHLGLSIDLLSDMLINSKFNNTDIEKEKSVVVEEINMYEDIPDEATFDLLNEIFFEDNPLSMNILGTKDSILSLNKKSIIEYFEKHYSNSNIVLGVSGRFNPNLTVKHLNTAFKAIRIDEKVNYNQNPYVNNKNSIKGFIKPINQVQLMLGFNAPSTYSPDLMPMMLVNTHLGGTNSSRLFQTIREDLGLAYYIDSSISSYVNTGMLSINVGLAKENTFKTLELVKKELEYLKTNYLTNNQIAALKLNLKGYYTLSNESSFSQVSSACKDLLCDQSIYSLEKEIRLIEEVTQEDIIRVVDNYIDYSKLNIAYTGNINNKSNFEANIANILFRG